MLADLLQSSVPTSVDVAAWAVCGLTALAGLDRLLKFKKDHLSETPPPAATYMTKVEAEQQGKATGDRVTAVEKGLSEIKVELREMEKGRREGEGKLHARIDQILEAVSKLTGYVEGIERKRDERA